MAPANLPNSYRDDFAAAQARILELEERLAVVQRQNPTVLELERLRRDEVMRAEVFPPGDVLWLALLPPVTLVLVGAVALLASARFDATFAIVVLSTSHAFLGFGFVRLYAMRSRRRRRARNSVWVPAAKPDSKQ